MLTTFEKESIPRIARTPKYNQTYDLMDNEIHAVLGQILHKLCSLMAATNVHLPHELVKNTEEAAVEHNKMKLIY